MVEIGIRERFDLIPKLLGLLVLNEFGLASRINHELCPGLDLIPLVFGCDVDDELELRLVEFQVV